MNHRTYTADDGTIYREWPDDCAGLEPTPGSAPFMTECGADGDPVYCTTIGMGDVRYVLCYCEDHLGQHPAIEGDA